MEIDIFNVNTGVSNELQGEEKTNRDSFMIAVNLRTMTAITNTLKQNKF